MSAHRNALPLGVLVALVLGLIAGCGSTAPKTSCGESGAAVEPQPGLPETLNVGVANNIAMAAPLTSLDSLGMAATDLLTASTPEELRVNFIAGRYDVAAMPINIAANLCARGIDVALLGTVSGNIVYLMGPPGTTLDDLRGHTVHVPFKNDIVDLMTRQILDGADISYQGPEPEVTLEYHPTPLDIATGLSAGDMTYAVVPEHLATVVSDATPETVKAVSLQSLWIEQTDAATLPFAGYVIRGELAQRYPDLVAELQINFVTSVDAVRADPAAGADAIADVVPVPAEVTAVVLPELSPVFTPAVEGRADTTLLYEALLRHESEAVGGAVPADGFYLGESR